MDINGTCHSVHVNRVSVLSGLILEKIYELLFRHDKRNRSLYPGVRIKRVSIGRGSYALSARANKSFQKRTVFVFTES